MVDALEAQRAEALGGLVASTTGRARCTVHEGSGAAIERARQLVEAGILNVDVLGSGDVADVELFGGANIEDDDGWIVTHEIPGRGTVQACQTFVRFGGSITFPGVTSREQREDGDDAEPWHWTHAHCGEKAITLRSGSCRSGAVVCPNKLGRRVSPRIVSPRIVSPFMTRPILLAVSLLVLVACDQERGLNERREIAAADVPAVNHIVRQDIDRGLRGVEIAAERVARGFLVEDRSRLARELRTVMRRFQEPPRPIPELMVSPITFLAAVGMDGRVIARDAEPDTMVGFDLAETCPVVQRALDGALGYELSELPSLEEGGLPSVTIIFAAPSRHEGRVVGAMVTGLPLWRLAQQMTRQLQLDNASQISGGELIWVLILRGDEPHYHAGFPPDLREMVPDAARRARGLSGSPHGFTGERTQYGRWYGYGVLPMPAIADDVQVIIFRSDPV